MRFQPFFDTHIQGKRLHGMDIVRRFARMFINQDAFMLLSRFRTKRRLPPRAAVSLRLELLASLPECEPASSADHCCESSPAPPWWEIVLCDLEEVAVELRSMEILGRLMPSHRLDCGSDPSRELCRLIVTRDVRAASGVSMSLLLTLASLMCGDR